MLVYVYAFVRVGLLRACVYMRVAASVCVHVSVLRLRPDVGVYVVRTRSNMRLLIPFGQLLAFN